MANVKALRPKKQTIKAKPADAVEENDDAVGLQAGKIKKVIEVELGDEIVAPLEKLDDDAPVVSEDGEELSTDELGLDEEEINPFGDKWEE